MGDDYGLPPVVRSRDVARFLGFFSDRTTVSEFETPVEPLGAPVLKT